MTDKIGDDKSGGIKRLLPVDALRGLIIVLMALDHANYFIAQLHSSGEYWGGHFPAYDHPLLFLTRFVTHVCAPGFFLMGVGMTLFADSRRPRGWGEWQIRRHFWLRGAILMALQLLVVNRAWEATPGGWNLNIYIGVLFALGLTMVIASFLLRLNPGYLVAIIIVLLIGTELLVPSPSEWGAAYPVFQHLFLFAGGDAPTYWVNYPALAWLELVVFGLLFGRWLAQEPKMAYRRALYLGAASLMAFVLLRATDGFGNLRRDLGEYLGGFPERGQVSAQYHLYIDDHGDQLAAVKSVCLDFRTLAATAAPIGGIRYDSIVLLCATPLLYAAIGHWFAPQGSGTIWESCMPFGWLGWRCSIRYVCGMPGSNHASLQIRYCVFFRQLSP